MMIIPALAGGQHAVWFRGSTAFLVRPILGERDFNMAQLDLSPFQELMPIGTIIGIPIVSPGIWGSGSTPFVFLFFVIPLSTIYLYITAYFRTFIARRPNTMVRCLFLSILGK